MLKTLKAVLRKEKGFTLIELLAVMSIIAVLAGIVSTSVSGTSETSRDAAARQDAGTFTSAAADFFSDQEGAEVLTPTTVTVTALFNDETESPITSTKEVKSSRWPEVFITDELASLGDSTTSPYINEFPTANADSAGLVVRVNIRGKDDSDGNPGDVITRSQLLTGFTAVDFDALVTAGFAESDAASFTQTTEALGVDFHNFLWLFKKSTSAGGSGANDSRVISLFKLVSAEIIDTDPADTVELSYKQIQ